MNANERRWCLKSEMNLHGFLRAGQLDWLPKVISEMVGQTCRFAAAPSRAPPTISEMTFGNHSKGNATTDAHGWTRMETEVLFLIRVHRCPSVVKNFALNLERPYDDDARVQPHEPLRLSAFICGCMRCLLHHVIRGFAPQEAGPNLLRSSCV